MISYYELLGMTKEGKAPNKIKVYLTPCTSKIYVREDDLDESFSYYRLDEREEEDENYRDYLAECYLESSMFDATIEILDEKKIEKLDIKYDDIKYSGDSFFREQILMYCNNLQYKINEIIDFLNKEE